jgi:hypothetical protein
MFLIDVFVHHFAVRITFKSKCVVFCGAKLSIINNLMGIFNFNFYEIYNQRVGLLIID